MRLNVVSIKYKSLAVPYSKPEKNVCKKMLNSLHVRGIITSPDMDTLLLSLDRDSCLIVTSKALISKVNQQSIPLWPDLVLPVYTYNQM